MKKKIISILAAAAMFISCSSLAIAKTNESVTADLSPDFTIVVDGVERVFYNADGDEVHPIVYNGTTYLPLRAIGELMDKNVNWDQSTLTITLSGTRGDSTVDGEEDPSAKAKEITVDVRYDFTIIVDGAVQTFKDVNGGTVYPILYEGSTYLPVRAIGELMGKSVSWDGDTKTVYIGGSDSLVTDADSFNSGTVTDADSFNTAMPSKPDGGKDIEYQQQVPPSNQQQSNQPRPDEGFGKGNSNINPEKADKTDKTDKSYEADITLEEAKAAALEDADLDEDDVTFTKTKIDYEDGTLVYDIEFYTADAKYEYEINASTGAVISSDVDIKTSGAASGVSITLDEAKEIALAHAGLDSADVTFAKAKLDTDDGVKVYDIEFRYGTTEYEYEINASTGEIESYDTDTDN